MASKPAPDAFLAVCPSRMVLARLGEKWALLCLVALASGALRFGTMRRRLEGVSQKMLTQTLRHLERDGLITRRLFNEMPLRVEYELTPRGRDVLPLALALKYWVERNFLAIAASNQRYDSRVLRERSESRQAIRSA